MSPPDHPPGEGPNGKSAADREEELRQQAIQLAMMADLGLARVDELPLDTEHRDHRGHGRGGHDSRANGRRNQQPLRVVTVTQRAHPNGNAGWSMNDTWKDAIAAGLFNDADARGVKGLDDLGGGRLYDKAVGGMSQSNAISDQTRRILEQRTGRPHLGYFTVVIFNRKFCQWPISTWQDYASGANNVLGITFRDGEHSCQGYELGFTKYSEMLQFMETAKSLKAGKHLDQVESTSVPISMPTVAPAATPAPSLAQVSTPAPASAQVAGTTPTPTLAHAQVPTPAPGSTQAPTPAPGLAQVSTPAPALIPIADAVRNPIVSTTTVVASSVGVENPGNASSGTNGGRGPQTSTQTTNGHVPGTRHAVGQGAASATKGHSTVALAAESARTQSEEFSGSSHEDKPVDNTGDPVQDTLIAFDEDDVSVASPHPSEATELLSTLEPYPSGSGTHTSYSHMSASNIIEMARGVFNFFLFSGAGGPTVTVEETIQVADGVRSGVMEHVMQDARLNGAGPEALQEVENMVNRIFTALAEANHRAQVAHAQPSPAQPAQPQLVETATTQSRPAEAPVPHAQPGQALSTQTQAAQTQHGRAQNRRIEYSAEQLLSLRLAAVQPPASLASNPYLPKSDGRAWQISTPSSGRLGPRSSPRNAEDKPWASFGQSQVKKSANAMQWVLGGELGAATEPEAPKPETKQAAETEPAPQRETQETQTAASGTAGRSVTQDSGLQSSRWASGGTGAKHANYFTGPAYEKTWAKRSYLEDLAQLDPQARVTAGAEDLMDFYFPLPNNDEISAGPGATQLPANGVQDVASTGNESEVATPERTDNIETLRVGISRLSIESPPAASQSHAPLRTQALSSVVHASRELQVQATSHVTTEVTRTPVDHHHQHASQPYSVNIPGVEPTQEPAASPAPQPRLRGLAASRHSTGPGPANAGNFRHHVTGRK
ncbi:hypothetical protein NEMBOFW57_006075 [Staphylotrichum longicolle]|uniref:Uncharacterized protein n=1 Tax=Staphylotrichum longicolle TaxID=669026 RepID=A0AAD4HWI1_9PEZI|nr:hypothetical protein NEMBOFW57_006075 [Staphylotrichum longicolle]